MHLVDTHAHLDDGRFDTDRDDVIARAHAAGVETIITIGTTAETSDVCIQLAARHPGLWAAVGIQPNHSHEAQPGDWDRIVELASAAKVVAIGETGLDRYWKHAAFDIQQDYFDRHLRLSQERDLPFVVHTRESDADVLAMLRELRHRGPLRGVMHSFTGTAETAAECVELGLHVSFAGMVTFKKSDDLRAVAATIPADRILVETDSPYLSPEPLRGRRNEPANVLHTATCVAATRGQEPASFFAQVTQNAKALFGLA